MDRLRSVLLIGLLMAAAATVSILITPETRTAWLWEFLPAVMASMITTYGLKKMKEKT
ncbi:MAG: hypothetical protein ABEJ95_05385 [Candidatus Nanohalobium sp.]